MRAADAFDRRSGDANRAATRHVIRHVIHHVKRAWPARRVLATAGLLLTVLAGWGVAQSLAGPVAGPSQVPAWGPTPVRFAKPITIVVTFPPGGGTDLLARKLGAELQHSLGQTVLVENRPGASGNIGARYVAEAPADGSTLLMVNSSFAINPGVYPHLDFDPKRDFTAVVNAGYIASVFVVPANSPARTLGEALAATRESGASRGGAASAGSSSAARTGSGWAGAGSVPLAFASCGNGTPQHLAGDMLAQALGSRLQHVPYKGCGPAITAVAAGQVPAGVVTASSAQPMLQAGRVRALAVTSPQRLPQLPQVPTVAEQGAPGFAVAQWHGLLAPAGTPPAVVAALHQHAQLALHSQAMRQMLFDQGYTPAQGSAADFQALIHADIDRFSQVTRQLGLRVD